MDGKVIDFFHNPAGFRVDFQLVFHFGTFAVANGGISGGMFSVFILCPHCGPYLLTGVFCVPFIEKVQNRNNITYPVFRVYRFCCGNIPCSPLCKVIFQILTNTNIVTAQAGNVFCDNTIDLSGLGVPYHALKIRTVKIGPAPTIVNVLAYNLKTLRFCKLGDNDALGFNALALPLPLIVLAKSHVCCCLNGLFHRAILLILNSPRL